MPQQLSSVPVAALHGAQASVNAWAPEECAQCGSLFNHSLPHPMEGLAQRSLQRETGIPLMHRKWGCINGSARVNESTQVSGNTNTQ